MGFLDRVRSLFQHDPAWTWFATLDGGASWLWFDTFTVAWFDTFTLPKKCQPCAACGDIRPCEQLTENHCAACMRRCAVCAAHRPVSAFPPVPPFTWGVVAVPVSCLGRAEDNLSGRKYDDPTHGAWATRLVSDLCTACRVICPRCGQPRDPAHFASADDFQRVAERSLTSARAYTRSLHWQNRDLGAKSEASSEEWLATVTKQRACDWCGGWQRCIVCGRIFFQGRTDRQGTQLTPEVRCTTCVRAAARWSWFTQLTLSAHWPWFATLTNLTSHVPLGLDEDTEEPLTLDRALRNRHLYLIGLTRMGKTTLMLNLMRADFVAGAGVGFIDPAGDAAHDVLGYVPSSRASDVIFFDPTRDDCPALNLLALPYDRDKLAQEILSVLALFFNINQNTAPRLYMLLRNGLLALLDDRDNEPHSLADLERLYKDASYCAAIAERAADPRLRRFLTDDLPRFKRADLDPVLNKLDAFLSTRVLSRLFGTTTNALDFDAILNRQRVLICSLSKGKIGEEPAKFLGGLIVAALTVAALARADQPPASRADFYLYVDEFQNYATSSFTTILSEAAKYRLNLTLAHQTRGQLSAEIHAAIGNVGTTVAFQVSPDDAGTLSHAMAEERERTITPTERDIYQWTKSKHAQLAYQREREKFISEVRRSYGYKSDGEPYLAMRLREEFDLTQLPPPPTPDDPTESYRWPAARDFLILQPLHAIARIGRADNVRRLFVPFPPDPNDADAEHNRAAVLEHQRQRYEIEKKAAAGKNRPLTIPQEPRSSIETTQDPHENATTLPTPPPVTVSVPIAGPNGDREAPQPDDDTDDFLT